MCSLQQLNGQFLSHSDSNRVLFSSPSLKASEAQGYKVLQLCCFPDSMEKATKRVTFGSAIRIILNEDETVTEYRKPYCFWVRLDRLRLESLISGSFIVNIGRKLKNEMEILGPSDQLDLRIEGYTSIFCYGASHAGKTSESVNIILNKEKVYSKEHENTIIFFCL